MAKIGAMISSWGAVYLTFAGVFLIFAVAPTSAIDWPQGYVVHEESESPDGQYGILVPSMEAWEKDEFLAESNYLANLKTHQVLGKIEGADYFEHQNHRHLDVQWSQDFKLCAATYWGRFGFESIDILEPKNSTFVQTTVTGIREALDQAMKKQSRDKEISGDANPYIRFGPGRKVRVRALAQNNPKQFEGVKTYYALFQGTFDLESEKSTVSDARSITSEQNDALGVAYDDNLTQESIVRKDPTQVSGNFRGKIYQSEEEKFNDLDDSLNKVYQAVRIIVNPKRFAKVKDEQLGWLQTRNAAKSVEEKSKLTEDRIKALQDLLW